MRLDIGSRNGFEPRLNLVLDLRMILQIVQAIGIGLEVFLEFGLQFDISIVP
jgi:hypothetical protein